MSTRPSDPPVTPLDDVADWLRAAGVAPRWAGAAQGAPGGVSGLSLSSRRIEPGDLYAALPGARVHGADFAEDAVASGAVAILTDVAGEQAAVRCDRPVLVVEEPRAVLGRLAAWLHGSPASAMAMIGVTGTQGKTTTTRLAASGLQGAAVTSAVVGTVGTRIAGEDVATSLTTPEAPDLHALFATMRERGVAACAMEVSSHALVMGRVDGVVFDVAVFLNLGRDHLDFHRDVEDYYQAKASLFTPEHARLALVNVDDAHGRRLAGETSLPVRTFSSRGAQADWTASRVRSDDRGSTFVVRDPAGRSTDVRLPLLGAFNVENALAALAAVGEAGFDVEAVARGLEQAAVPGRFERVEAGQRFAVVVDYAHKPDAVEAAIAALRPLASGRLVVVLGAGGDRDRGKRPLMGEIAGRLADVLVVTDDNPRTEDPAAIRAAVLAGAEGTRARLLEVGERRAAIAAAVDLLDDDEDGIVLVAGKGHETGQEVDGVLHPFDDRVVAAEAIRARLARGGAR